MINMFEEKEKLTAELSEQYSKSIINLNDFEKMIDEVNKIDSAKELIVVKKMVYENPDLSLIEDGKEKDRKAVEKENNTFVMSPKKFKKRKYENIFSSRSITAEPVNGHAGKFSCVFGSNQIKINSLPRGETVLQLETAFGSTEIFVPKRIKIVNEVTAVFASVSVPDNEEIAYEDQPELRIKGDAVFANITVHRI
jgi:hypothetical protein